MNALLALLALLPSAALAARLRVYQAASATPATGDFLPPVTTLCPDMLFKGVFTLECVPDAPATSATFWVDGDELRTERVVPYILTGDNTGNARPWDYPKMASVMCKTSNGDMAKLDVTFMCPDDSGMGDSKPRTEPARMPTPSPKPKPDMMEEKEPEPVRTPPPTMASGECVKIPAMRYIGSKSSNWKPSGAGLVYKQGNPSTSTDGPEAAPLKYMFKAPKNGRYVISLDMKTENGVDHNDVWVRFPDGGVSLEKPGSMQSDGGWVKAYHNANSRKVEAFSVDFNPHVISTKKELKAGMDYVVEVAGRSTKVTLFGVVMVQCSGDSCGNSAAYRRAINKCGML